MAIAFGCVGSVRYAFGIKLRLSCFGGFWQVCDMPLALSSAYRVLVVLGVCDMPLALSSAYRVLVLGGMRSHNDIKAGFYAICLLLG
ncbi:hypothetical protein IQ247_04405 [Plectonema cf. radiosum LEGE 06105]|uniref:Uncharacterized protein n=1 Tax=Plectonema cf. radiosum LEGE 06105 TaxID=945769 RepID=A0A8J7EZU2_9CYAN|nr:hypothetical protein [Plectonema radiosum]MBE9211967.1 hypothetical protein [Plectonema cf. radiosum LEGE 06105]